MSYIGQASTAIIPVKSYENLNSSPYITTPTPVTYLTITFTPEYSGYALIEFSLQAESATAVATAKGRAQIYQDNAAIGFATTVNNPGNGHFYELNGLKRVAVVGGVATTIEVRVSYLTNDSQSIISGTMVILTNLS